jgi:hypothetical protein
MEKSVLIVNILPCCFLLQVEMPGYDPVPADELTPAIQSIVEPLEVDLESVGPRRDDAVFSWKDPWLLTTFVGTLAWIALLIGVIMVYDLTGRIWPAFLFSVHLCVSLWIVHSFIPSDDFSIPPPSLCRRLITAGLDFFFFFLLYPTVLSILIDVFFTDIDTTVVIEYTGYHQLTSFLRRWSQMVALTRLVVELTSVSIIIYYQRNGTEITQHFPRSVATCFAWMESNAFAWSEISKRRLRRTLLWNTQAMLWLSMGLFLWTSTSMLVHWGNWRAPTHDSPYCDPLDTTECILPFPSFHFAKPDETTATGWRVDIPANVLPRLKGGVKLHPNFLNDLDGFSTMAPLLFYVKGMKEAQEIGNIETRLQGHENIHLSVTRKSVTLLIDMDKKKLVPHSAEIDYLDDAHPLVMVFPAQPLRHNTHYALAVVGARNVKGDLLPPTQGMKLLLGDISNSSSTRSVRFREKVLPTLYDLAPWTRDDGMLQLLFDFPTISHESQLGQIKAVRDATIHHIESEEWLWTDRVKIIRKVDNSCRRDSDLIARTVHGVLDVPWFLRGYGNGHRAALLNKEAVARGSTTLIGKAHFVVHIPCSVRAAAIQGLDVTNPTAVVEFGHGLFYNRNEASWRTLSRMANESRYIVMAMDWRGMSSFDLLVVIKTLMSQPRLFEAVRDNLIQGYANKLALQHFARNSMLGMEWMQFGSRDPMSLSNRQPPPFVFYGVSQGGILGAGYSVLSGPTKLIDRAVLGVPGTPFALIMSRSLDFLGYDAIMLLNFYNNRHVRIFLSFAQMLWDTCEGAGALAPPIEEDIPRLLLQAGLGDVVVPSLAAEALTRGLGGVTLPGNPRQDIFGIPVAEGATKGSLGPKVTLTELLFKHENASMPHTDNYRSAKNNGVHWCVREDLIMIEQVKEFINTGRVIDVCINETACVRRKANCLDDGYYDQNVFDDDALDVAGGTYDDSINDEG